MTFLPVNALQVPLDENVSFSDNWDFFLEQITKRYRDIAREVNVKERAFYPLEQEILNNQKWFINNNPQNFRSCFRQVFYFGAIAAGATLNIPHNITELTLFTKISGTVITNIPDYRPLPFVDTINVTNQIRINATAIDIVITNGATAPNITQGIVILEYLKN